jgi:hypothetical protein
MVAEQVLDIQRLPEPLILDDGPKFDGTALDVWAAQHATCTFTLFSRETGPECVSRELQRQISG